MVGLTQELIADKDVIALACFLNTAGLVELMKRSVLVEGKIAMIAPIGPMNTTNFYPIRPGYNEEAEKLLSEAAATQKKRVAMVYYNQAFGPSVFKFAEESAKKQGVNIVATAVFETAPDKMEAGIAAAADTLAKAGPDAVIVIAAGGGALNFVKRFRGTPAGGAQLYALSPADSFGFVKVAGLEAARGVAISQAIPYPAAHRAGSGSRVPEGDEEARRRQAALLRQPGGLHGREDRGGSASSAPAPARRARR